MPVFNSPDDAPDRLTRLLLIAVPENERGFKTLSNMAARMGVTKWAMRKWIKNQRIPASRAKRVVEIGEGRVELRDFDEFVYKD